MIFTLEALQARHGDCLLLHYGPADDPKLIVIDGGPARVYDQSLRPRLQQLKAARSPNAPLPISLLMVSHMDDDHVNGVLELTDELREADDDSREAEFDLQHLWFNAFDDIVGNRQIPVVSGLSRTASVADLGGAVPAFANLDHHVAAVIASTGQGRALRDGAELLTIPVNSPFSAPDPNKPPLVRGDTDESEVDWDDGLAIQVVHPDETRLKEMQKKWDKDLRKAAADGDDSIVFASLSDRDKSPFNLASIVCVVSLGGKRILLTGDARDDDIVDGLAQAELLDHEGRAHFDILKIPHHGSDRNVSRNFFEKITADHYVVSGNGEHHNPDKSTLVMLSMATRGNDDFTVHLTNHDGKHDLGDVLDEFIADDRARGRTYGFTFRQQDALSLRIDLLEEFDA